MKWWKAIVERDDLTLYSNQHLSMSNLHSVSHPHTCNMEIMLSLLHR